MLQQTHLPNTLCSNVHKVSSTTRLCTVQHQSAAGCRNTRQLSTLRFTVRTAAEAAKVDTSDDRTNVTWESFAANVSGEWEGVSVTFSPDGAAQQLPEHYVPEAFREWGVELRDWQTQCSCNAVASDDGRYEFRCTLRRLMPTVGCEADAIAFTEEQTSTSSSSSEEATAAAAGSSMVIAAKADGSYNMGPEVWPLPKTEIVTKLQIEHCFMLPINPQQQQQQQQRYRVKVVQQFRHNWLKSGAWQLDCVDLHRERYDGPYTGKRELAGCGGGQQPIAQLTPLQQQQLMTMQGSSWTPAAAAANLEDILIIKSGSICSSSSSSAVELLVDRMQALPAAAAAAADDGDDNDKYHYDADGVQLTLLPLDVWSAVAVSKEGLLLQAEAGILLNPSSSSSSSNEIGDVSAAAGSSRLVSVRAYGDEDGLLQNAVIMQQLEQQR